MLRNSCVLDRFQDTDQVLGKKIDITRQVWYQTKATNFEYWREAMSNLQLPYGLTKSLFFRDPTGSILLGSSPPGN